MENNTKIECPVCNQIECFKESSEEHKIDSYLCVGCGFTTTSKHLDDSVDVRSYEKSMPELIKNSKFVDSNKLCWYPSVINFPSKGYIFPDGTHETNWKWSAAKIVDIPLADQSKYPVPGKENQYYNTRLDVQNKMTYNKNDFKSACKFIGIIE